MELTKEQKDNFIKVISEGSVLFVEEKIFQHQRKEKFKI